MRRALYVLAALVVGAVAPALAQARVRSGIRLDPQPSGPPSAVVHISNLLDDPMWSEALSNAYTIHVHWRLRLWRKSWLFDGALTTIEWDDDVQQVPVLDEFSFREGVQGRAPKETKFATLELLKQQVEREVTVPTPPGLPAGRWYYALDVTISTVTDARGGSEAGGLSSVLQRFILGGGPSQSLSTQTSATFTVRSR
jgi:hypothetical protein